MKFTRKQSIVEWSAQLKKIIDQNVEIMENWPLDKYQINTVNYLIGWFRPIE